MASSMRSLLPVFGVLLLAIAVQAQWPFGGGEDGGGWNWGPQQNPRATPTQGWAPWVNQPSQQAGAGWPWNILNPPQQTGGAGWPSWGYNPQPTTPSRVTVTITRTQPGYTGGFQPTQPPVSMPGQAPPYQGADPTRTWSQPSAWGPPRSPFGNPATSTGPQTIPTTTTDAPRPNVPFLTTCGTTKYVEDDVSNALIAGCYYKNKTQTVNKSEYPKVFQNTYQFNFGDVQGPFWEFPLISSAAYIGGNAGPDRVIFNGACFLAGEITQSGAGWKGFTECREAY